MKQLIIFDFETTGLNPQTDYPTEIAAKKIDLLTGQKTDYSSLIKLPEGVEVPEFITKLTGLTTEYIQENGTDADTVEKELLEFFGEEFAEDTLFVGHNVNFDLGFLAVHFGMYPENYVCTRTAAILDDPSENASLQKIYNRLFPAKKQTHRAQGDIEMTEALLVHFIGKYGETMEFFKNKLVVMPDRGLVFTPPHAIVLDFSKQYVSKREYDKLKGGLN